MKTFLLALTFLLVAAASPAFGQVDEVSSATGLPIPIGAPVIYGQVSVENIPRGERRPTIFVTLSLSGIQVDRRPVNELGYFFFLQAPRPNQSLLFEMNGTEIGRAYIPITNGNRARQDVTVDWNSVRSLSIGKTGTVSANAYPRSPEAEKSFEAAMAAVKENKNDVALKLFNELVQKDAKDYLSWTMIGQIHYADKKYGEAVPPFTKALELKPDFLLARVTWGRVALSQKEFDKAVEILTKAVEVDPNSADANHYLGEAYLQIKKGSLAVGYLNKAIELAPAQKADIHLRLAALYNGAGAKDRAAAEYKAFLEKNPTYAEKSKLEQYIKENGR